MANTVSGDEDRTTIRLDALIRMYVENVKRMDKTFTDTEAIQILHSVGLSPTEIAHIMGRKSKSSISGELYSGKRKRK